MKIAIIGSRTLRVSNLEDYVPKEVSEIVSGGAKGIDSDARAYALRHHVTLTEFVPDYARYGRGAPLVRNHQSAEYANAAIAFWDGCSKGTLHIVRLFEKQGKHVTIVLLMRK